MSLTVKNDPAKTQAGLEAGLKPILNNLLVGAAEDLTAFGALCAQRIARAAEANRPDLVEELKGQFTALLEQHKLAAAKARNEALGLTLNQAIDLAFKTANGALRSITVA